MKLDLPIAEPHLVVIPDDVCTELRGSPGRARIPVQATFDGVPYQGSVVSMGGAMVLGIQNGILAAIGKTIGDVVTVTIERDVAERTVEVPADLAKALRAAGAREAFDALSYTARKEHVRGIEEAKKPETRATRVERAVAAVRT